MYASLVRGAIFMFEVNLRKIRTSLILQILEREKEREREFSNFLSNNQATQVQPKPAKFQPKPARDCNQANKFN